MITSWWWWWRLIYVFQLCHQSSAVLHKDDRCLSSNPTRCANLRAGTVHSKMDQRKSSLKTGNFVEMSDQLKPWKLPTIRSVVASVAHLVWWQNCHLRAKTTSGLSSSSCKTKDNLDYLMLVCMISHLSIQLLDVLNNKGSLVKGLKNFTWICHRPPPPPADSTPSGETTFHGKKAPLR